MVEIIDNASEGSTDSVMPLNNAPVVPPPAEVSPAPAEVSSAPVDSTNTGKTYKNVGVVDLVFLIDVTGSMRPCIEALRDNIKVFIDMMTNQSGNGSPVTDWRARVVGYRDYLADKDTPYGWLVDNPFTRDKNVLERQLSDLKARGGGDEPESLLDAMMALANAGKIDMQATTDEDNTNKWRPDGDAARIIVVFTDATYHDTMSLAGFEGAGVRDLYNVMRQEHIKPYFFVPVNACYSILGRMKGAILTECGDGGNGLVDMTNDRSKFNELLTNLAQGVSQSASATNVRVVL